MMIFQQIGEANPFSCLFEWRTQWDNLNWGFLTNECVSIELLQSLVQKKGQASNDPTTGFIIKYPRTNKPRDRESHLSTELNRHSIVPSESRRSSITKSVITYEASCWTKSLKLSVQSNQKQLNLFKTLRILASFQLNSSSFLKRFVL